MGLLDKVKVQAGQIAEKAQQGVAQGKDKIEEIQAQKKRDGLMRNLGAAYFAQVRHGGPKAAVDEAMAAVDAHMAEYGEELAQTHIDITDTPGAE